MVCQLFLVVSLPFRCFVSCNRRTVSGGQVLRRWSRAVPKLWPRFLPAQWGQFQLFAVWPWEDYTNNWSRISRGNHMSLVSSGAGIAQSVQWLAMSWKVRGSNPGGGEIFRTYPDLPLPTRPPVQWVPGLSWGQRWPGRDADHPPPSSSEVMKEWSYTSTPPLGSCSLLQGETLPYLPW